MDALKKLLVIQVAALGYDQARTLQPGNSSSDAVPELKPLQSGFPAVTCTAQADFRTGTGPDRHGMIANGLYHRALRKVLFWEQSAHLVSGPRIWDSFRSNGGKVGMLFWQQSLGEKVDWILSPRPIHKHSGGMIQDCFSRPDPLYDELVAEIGRPFNLMHYWGPLASRKSTDWIVDATCAVLKRADAPEVLFTYLPDLDYDLQRFGPAHPKAEAALGRCGLYLERLCRAAREQGYEVLIFGDYAIGPVSNPVFPNTALREAGLLPVRMIKNMAYPDFFSPGAFAMVDHEVAHVFCDGSDRTARAAELLSDLPGVASCTSVPERPGELVLVAEEGSWFAYPWWSSPGEAPDYAGHVDIHNKPGFDPCELFFGWPPGSVSRNPARIGGSHGRSGAGREVAWGATFSLPEDPDDLPGLGRVTGQWLDSLGKDVN